MKLKDYLKEYGVTKAHIARKVGVSEVSVANWASGINLPSPMAIKNMEKATEGKVCFVDWVGE